MRPIRLSITALMTVVAFAALSIAALRSRSDAWSTFFYLTTCSTLTLATVAAAIRNGRRRAGALAFALSGAAYLALCLGSDPPTSRVLWAGYRYLDPPPPPVVRPVDTSFSEGLCWFPADDEPGIAFSDLSGHCLFALAIASVAGMTVPLLLPKDEPMNDDPASPRRARRWLRPASYAVMVPLVLGMALVGLRLAPGPTASAALLGTGGILAFALVAATSSQGGRRAAFFGFALFGAGYMALAFGPKSLPTFWPRLTGEHLIDAARSVLPHSVTSEVPDSSDALGRANSRIRHALDSTVTLPLHGEVTLDDFFKAVRSAARGPDGQPIPIHVDPDGLQDADKTLASTVVIDFDTVRLRTSLNLILAQVNLTHYVVDGVLVITSNDSDTQDQMLGLGSFIAPAPYLVVGHCVLALMAASLGGLVARRFAGPRPDPIRPGRDGEPLPKEIS